MHSQAEPGNEKCGTMFSRFSVSRQFLNRRTTFKVSYGTIAALNLAYMMREGVPAKQDRCWSSGSQLIPRPGKLVLSFGRRSSGFHLTHSAERLVPFPGNHKRCRNQEQRHNTHKDVSNKVWPLN